MCIFCCLKDLFCQYEFGNYSHIPPKEIRSVVSRVFTEEQRFQMDKMVWLHCRKCGRAFAFRVGSAPSKVKPEFPRCSGLYWGI